MIRVHRVAQATLDPRVLRGPQVLQVLRVPQASLGLLDLQVLQVLRVPQASLEPLDLLEPQVIQVSQGLQGLRDWELRA